MFIPIPPLVDPAQLIEVRNILEGRSFRAVKGRNGKLGRCRRVSEALRQWRDKAGRTEEALG